MSELVHVGNVLPATSPDTLKKLAAVEDLLLANTQLAIRTEHILHGGMYARSIVLEPEQVITGALIRIPTILVVNGHCSMLVDDGWHMMNGYHVLPASAGRKQAFVAWSRTSLTMLFPTDARTVEEAEAQFTDEADRLLSRQSSEDTIIITGE